MSRLPFDHRGDAVGAWMSYAVAWLNRRVNRCVNVVGITGSAGKTTVKDLCSAALSEFAPCCSPPRSANRRRDLVRLIGALRRTHGFCTAELSAERPGYLDSNLRLVLPDVAVLTLIGRDIYSAFKSIEAIAEEKAKLVSALQPIGVAVLNIDVPLVRRIGESCNRRVVWVGRGEGASVRLIEARSVWPEPLTLSVEIAGNPCTIDTCRFERFCPKCRRLFESTEDVPGESGGLAWHGEPPVSRAVRVIAGLGNPGKRYENTPHNAGHAVLERLADECGGVCVPQPERLSCFIEAGGGQVALFKSDALINLSVTSLLTFLLGVGGHRERPVVVLDEMDLSLGYVRVKRGGGNAGHKGGRSVTAALGTPDFRRVRIGIRKEADDRKARGVVLEASSAEDLARHGEGCAGAVS